MSHPLRQFASGLRRSGQYSARAVELVWTTNRGLAIGLAVLSLLAGLMPAGIAYVGKLIIDAVVHAAATGAEPDRWTALGWVAVEAGLVATQAGIQRGIGTCQSLLRMQLSHKVNMLILDKALTLELRHFEDSELYDKMTRARREASSRPLSLVIKTFGLAQNVVSLVSYGGLLLAFSGWAVAALVAAALPAFIAETVFSGEAFRLMRWRTPEFRQQMYLETVMANDGYAKEVKVFNLGDRLLDRYRAIYDMLYTKDRSLTLRRDGWGFGLGLLSTAAFYGAYAWIAISTARGLISLGEMTMYVMLFRQGQAALSSSLSSIGGMYEDNLYLSNLYDFLEEPVPPLAGGAQVGPTPGDGIRFEQVSFVYPGSESPALREVSLHLPPGKKLALVGENGSGKTTLIKLLAGLYQPSEGRITLDGLDLREWDGATLRARIGVIFQDFARYQFKVGENIGAGDESSFADEPRWVEAAQKGMAAPFIDELEQRYHTQLGRWFPNGRELSIGQWQKIALSRAFVRRTADILVLDEPTASMDAEAEARIFDHFRETTTDQMAILISHRFSTVRMADRIVVLDGGRVIEEGDHTTLMERDGRYAKLFTIQAAGYR